MRVSRHHYTSLTASRTLLAGAALLVALALTGCSAVNMTGFEMPVFGLTKKSAANSDGVATSSIPQEENQSAGQPRSLSGQY